MSAGRDPESIVHTFRFCGFMSVLFLYMPSELLNKYSVFSVSNNNLEVSKSMGF